MYKFSDLRQKSLSELREMFNSEETSATDKEACYREITRRELGEKYQIKLIPGHVYTVIPDEKSPKKFVLGIKVVRTSKKNTPPSAGAPNISMEVSTIPIPVGTYVLLMDETSNYSHGVVVLHDNNLLTINVKNLEKVDTTK